MHVAVTPRHIVEGLPSALQGDKCPIALAIIDAGGIPSIGDFWVGTTHIFQVVPVRSSEHDQRRKLFDADIFLPRVAIDWIQRLINEHVKISPNPNNIKPIEFELEV